VRTLDKLIWATRPLCFWTFGVSKHKSFHRHRRLYNSCSMLDQSQCWVSSLFLRVPHQLYDFVLWNETVFSMTNFMSQFYRIAATLNCCMRLWSNDGDFGLGVSSHFHLSFTMLETVPTTTFHRDERYLLSHI
jgi:hypothetical protein